MRAKTNSLKGFTRQELVFAMASLALIALVAGSRILKPRGPDRRFASYSSCINGLVTINGCKEQWALENNLHFGAVPQDTDLFGVSLYVPERPKCPQGGVYTLNPVGVAPTCSLPGHEWPGWSRGVPPALEKSTNHPGSLEK